MPLQRLPTYSDYFFFAVSSIVGILFFGLIIGMSYVEGDHVFSILAPPSNFFMQLASFIGLGIIYSITIASYPSPERMAKEKSPWQVAKEKAKENIGVGAALGIGFWLLVSFLYFASGERSTFLPTQMSQIDFTIILGIGIITTLSFDILLFFGRYEFPRQRRGREKKTGES
ncbi:MAG: hypothetical protein ACE5OZ_18410 [Candidatus Heimdallarchaeota archaeon]